MYLYSLIEQFSFKDIIENDDIDLDWSFRYSIIWDILKVVNLFLPNLSKKCFFQKSKPCKSIKEIFLFFLPKKSSNGELTWEDLSIFD
mgnify:CR=1 FL=1